MKIAGATVNQTPLDWGGNLNNILQAIDAARARQVELVCFPELSITGYGCEDLFLSEWVPSRAWAQLLTLLPATHNIAVCVGLPLRLNGTTFNGTCVIQNGRILGITLKQNMARDGVHYEPRWFDPWPAHAVQTVSRDGHTFDVGDLTYHIGDAHIGFEICEDAWRKDNRPGYRLAQRGVNLIMNPSASHFALGKSQLRESEVVAGGSDLFRCAYLFVNLLGNEAGRMIYDGDIVFAQQGKIIATNERLSFQPYNLLACDLNFDDPERTQTPGLLDDKDRNREFGKAVALGLFDYLRKSKAHGFVLSLSGGADSSCCAVLVAEMVRQAVEQLGVGKVSEHLNVSASDARDLMTQLLTCAYQGTKNSSTETLISAKGLANSIGATFHHWTIDDEVASYTAKVEIALSRSLTWETDDIALQNIQARARSPIIWLLANVKRAILLTTSNRSEGDVGYATMDGDTSGSLAPLAGIDKPFILQWLKWAERELHYPGLQHVNRLTPTAELRPQERAQTDEKDLMPYPVLVKIEKAAIRDRLSPLHVYHQLARDEKTPDLKKYIVKFFRLWAANQWKRERLAPSLHLDDLNVDPRTWCRFPILSAGFDEELRELEAAS
ncbi:MAG: NAD(+) synthase [Cyclobacteriaceae bacterium]|jgi:NAD+ synthase (glutamine-hydrolysing)